MEHKPWGPDFGFQPVMSLTSSLIAACDHKAGEPVGYGGTWVSESDTRLGVVAMDMICVDSGKNEQDKVGDPVVLWGEGLPVERIAEITKISAYELIARLTSRVAMKYIE